MKVFSAYKLIYDRENHNYQFQRVDNIKASDWNQAESIAKSRGCVIKEEIYNNDKKDRPTSPSNN